ncbi:MAG: MATE family efflux transporter [Clostridia bacterium]|nr:MATE family efflux transporter [Clostridia bacterium]
MSKSEIKDFTEGNITKQLLLFAAPLFLSNLLQVVYNMVDMAVVGATVGKEGISAVSVGGDIIALLTFVGMGFGGAGQVLIAKYVGLGQRKKIGRFVGTMSGFLTVAVAVLTLVGIVFREPLLLLMNTPSEAYSGALSYSVICTLGLIFIYGYNIVSAVLRGMGDSKHPFVFIAIAAAINVILDIVFVVWLGMGAAGAALATVISQAGSFVISVIYLILHRERFSLDVSFSCFIHWDREMLADLVRLGTPMAIKTASIQFSKLFVNSFINSYGIAVSAFAGIANKIASVANLISMAMNNAGSTMVGQNIAARKYSRVNKILLNLALITLTVSAVLSAVMLLAPDAVYSLFTTDPEVLKIGREFVPISLILFLAAALRAVMNALMNGSGNYKINFATAIFDGIVMRIGLALLFGIALGMEHLGFWLGDALAGFTPFVIGAVFYLSGKWRAKDSAD